MISLKKADELNLPSTLQAPGNHSSLPSLPLLFHPQLVQESTQKAQRGNYIHKSSGLKGSEKTSDLKSKHHQSVPQTKSRRKCGSPPTPPHTSCKILTQQALTDEKQRLTDPVFHVPSLRVLTSFVNICSINIYGGGKGWIKEQGFPNCYLRSPPCA